MATYWIGTSGYTHKEWRGPFYPSSLPDQEQLRYYAERFGSVELNYTFYRMPTERLLRSWAAQVPGDFVFGFKAPRAITHRFPDNVDMANAVATAFLANAVRWTEVKGKVQKGEVVAIFGPGPQGVDRLHAVAPGEGVHDGREARR